MNAKLIDAQNQLEEASADLTAKQLKYNDALAQHGEGSSKAAEAQAKLIKAENKREKAQTTVNAITQECQNSTSAYGTLMVKEEGEMRPFEEVLKSLQSAFAGLSEEEQISAASAIFGKNHYSSWLALINTAPDKVDELSESLHNCDGLTQEMADTMMSGFGGGIEKLKSSIDVLIYSMGISAPVVAIVAVIAVLTAAFKHLWDTNEDFRKSITAIWEGIKATFERLTSGIVDRLNALGFSFSDITEVIKAVWDVFCNWLAPIFENTFKYIGEILSAAVDVILGIVDFFIGLFTGNRETCWNGIKEIFTGIWDAIKSTIETVLELICNTFTTTWNSIKDFFVSIWTAIYNTITTVWTTIKDFFTSVFETISGIVSTVWNGIKTTISNVMTSIKTNIS
ncbi:MAG: phage tail tape measure protein, partial [Ruminococcus sp.]|nr:phage tail tape measure protein [Ruminococcus sp.]